MKKYTQLLFLLLIGALSACQSSSNTAEKEVPTAENDKLSYEEDTRTIRKIFDDALMEGEAYQLLEHLCLKIGTRLSGSKGAAKAVNWTKKVMEDYGFDTVYLQEVQVPHWERGAPEKVEIISNGQKTALNALAIGGSEPTPKNGTKAPVVMVTSLEEVEELGEVGVKGKIVFYNRPVDQRIINTGGCYGGAVDQRVGGASKAATYGAVAVVIRSVTTAYDDLPHTGTLIYDEQQPRIPAAALGFLSADKLEQALDANPQLELQLTINSQWFPDATSYNVVGELRGTENPEEIITIGGHLDSWDVGHGAHDDGAGCMQAIGTLRAFQRLGIKPKRTLRAVMFMNEENGSRGGIKYAEEAKIKGEKHILALESDMGGFSPRGFGVTAPAGAVEAMRPWLACFPELTIHVISKGGGGADIRHLHEAFGTPTAGFMPDNQRTFDYHHAASDVFENVNRRELELGTAAMTGFIYMVDKYGVPVE